MSGAPRAIVCYDIDRNGADAPRRRENDMTEKEISEAVASHDARMRCEDERAKQAIDEGLYTIAANAIAAASAHKGAIEELLFILDEMEVR